MNKQKIEPTIPNNLFVSKNPFAKSNKTVGLLTIDGYTVTVAWNSEKAQFIVKDIPLTNEQVRDYQEQQLFDWYPDIVQSDQQIMDYLNAVL